MICLDHSQNTYYKRGGYNKPYNKPYEQPPAEEEKPKKKIGTKDQVSDTAQGKGKVKTSNRFELLE